MRSSTQSIPEDATAHPQGPCPNWRAHLDQHDNHGLNTKGSRLSVSGVNVIYLWCIYTHSIRETGSKKLVNQ